MTKLPVISGRQLIKAMQKCGYYIRDQQGSHIHLRHPIKPPLTVPNHKTIARACAPPFCNGVISALQRAGEER